MFFVISLQSSTNSFTLTLFDSFSFLFTSLIQSSSENMKVLVSLYSSYFYFTLLAFNFFWSVFILFVLLVHVCLSTFLLFFLQYISILLAFFSGYFLFFFFLALFLLGTYEFYPCNSIFSRHLVFTSRYYFSFFFLEARFFFFRFHFSLS